MSASRISIPYRLNFSPSLFGSVANLPSYCSGEWICGEIGTMTTESSRLRLRKNTPDRQPRPINKHDTGVNVLEKPMAPARFGTAWRRSTHGDVPDAGDNTRLSRTKDVERHRHPVPAHHRQSGRPRRHRQSRRRKHLPIPNRPVEQSSTSRRSSPPTYRA